MHLAPPTALLPLLLTYPLVTLAHFRLNYPAVRGYDAPKLINFPCGGQNAPTPNRTSWSLSGGPIALKMGHTASAVQVLIGLGNDPGSAFNTVLLPTVQEEGPGDFCLDALKIPEGLNIKDGDNATIQVVSNGDPTGGLYNCADITFRANAPAAPPCKNNTGVVTKPYTGKSKNANGTDSIESATTSSTASSTASPTGSAAAAATSKPSVGERVAASGVMAVVGVVAVVFAVAL